MSIVNFKMSDDQKFRALWSLLNPSYNEAGEWLVEYEICAAYNEYAIVHNYAENKMERVYYVKDDETDSLSITDRKMCYIIDVDEDEKEVIGYLRKKGCHTNKQIEAHFSMVTEMENKISESDTKIVELNSAIATLTTERDEAVTSLAQLNADSETMKAALDQAHNDLNALTAEKDSLVAYKKNVEDTNKKAIISQYTDLLSAEVLNEYTANLDSYSIEDLDMRLTYEVKKARPTIFSHEPQPAYVPKENPAKSGLEDILSRYENKH